MRDEDHGGWSHPWMDYVVDAHSGGVVSEWPTHPQHGGGV